MVRMAVMGLSRNTRPSGFSEARAGPQGEASAQDHRNSAQARLRPGLRRATLGTESGASPAPPGLMFPW